MMHHLLIYRKYLRGASLLKSLWYSLRFRARIVVGRGSRIIAQPGARIRVQGGPLFIGMRYSMPQGTVLEIQRNGMLTIRGSAHITRGCKVLVRKNAVLEIGNRSYVNESSRIICKTRIEIGEECAIAWNVNILDTDEHNLVVDGVMKPKSLPVKIGNHVWIGNNVSVLKGVSVGDGAVVGCGAVVTKDIPATCLAVGSPARVIKENVSWQR